MTGKFFVFEGLDGSGLSTQSDLLRKYIEEKDGRVVLTKEQTDALIGGLIKSCLRHEWNTSPLALQMLFAADRAHHLDTLIEPALKEGKHVVCDRYIFSTLAFGGIKLDIDFLKLINSKFRKPDATFILDVPPEVCLQRIEKSRASRELFEEKEKFDKVRENYASLKDYFPNVYIINGNRPINEIFEDIKKIIEKLL